MSGPNGCSRVSRRGMFESLKLSDLNPQELVILRETTRTRPTLWAVEENGVRAVVKDFSTNGFLYRNIVGRFLIWRETKAYRRLRALKGVPRCHLVMGGLAIVLEEIKGRSLEGLEKEKQLPETFFDALWTLVERVHDRGLAHCDLKRAPNILVGDDGHPYIVDWSASISRKEMRFFPLNLIYQRFLVDDFNAITKVKLRHRPESVTPEEIRLLNHRSRGEKLVRAIRDRLREILQKVA